MSPAGGRRGRAGGRRTRAARDPGDHLQVLRRYWNVLAQAAAWLFALIGSFLLPPPTGTAPEQGDPVYRFALFLLTAFVGLMIFPILKWGRRRDAVPWGVASAALLASGTCSFLAYLYFYNHFTIDYAGERILVGSEFVPDVAEVLEGRPPEGAAWLLAEFGGEPEGVWTHGSVLRRRMVLSTAYLLCIPQFAACVIAGLQAIYCIAPRR